ncbi:putative glycolipid-binding domain-containing protein [Microbulbifer epialgicus]|uniref:Glycolipid-binding domain-containing protein n=1 Tax=Microbulbifer epialgicus TaxID=393907 RepID=A0ABV4P675_9GAMM
MSILNFWRRLDLFGSESSYLKETNEGWNLSGVATFLTDRSQCGISYTICCDKKWQTQTVKVCGHVGDRNCNIEIKKANGIWYFNEVKKPEIKDCIDIDLGFSPSTNLLPIRRLSLRCGQSAKIRAAWLQFPSMSLVPSEQIYTRESATRYRYESLSSSFRATLDVNEDGFVMNYPDLWISERINK